MQSPQSDPEIRTHGPHLDPPQRVIRPWARVLEGLGIGEGLAPRLPRRIALRKRRKPWGTGLGRQGRIFKRWRRGNRHVWRPNGIRARIGGRGMGMGRWGHGIPSRIMGDPGRLTAGRSLICPKRLSCPLVPRPRFGRALFFGLNRKEVGKPLNAAEDGCDCIPQKRKVPDLFRGPASIAAERRTFQRGTAAAPHKVQAVQRHNARTLGIMQCEMTACQA